MTLDLTDFIDIINNEKTTKRILKSDILEYESEFLNNFMKCVQIFEWSYHNSDGLITKDEALKILVDTSYRLIKTEINYYINNNHWSKDNFINRWGGTGRLIISLVDFELTDDHAWLDIEFSTTL